jgi:tRNA(Ile)-lysidine synthase
MQPGNSYRIDCVSELLEYLRNLPEERGGLRPGQRVVVGLSGGADSIALVGLLHALGHRVYAAHLDHRLRPDSAQDRTFCREFCRERGIVFASARADVAGRASRTGEGIEAAGRTLRRAWLERVRRHYRAHRIALAHQLDDHAETILMWLGRGTGLSGLAGIRPVTGRIVRPLLQVRREDLRAECARQGWPWREDPSNLDLARLRNRIREEVLPAFEAALGPGSIERMAGMSERAAAERAALAVFAAEFVDRTLVAAGEGRLELDLAAWRAAPQVIVFQALREAVRQIQGPRTHQRWNEARYRDVLHFIRHAEGGRQTDLPGGGRLHLTRSSLLLENARSNRAIRPLARLELKEQILTGAPAELDFRGHDRAVFDADRVHPPFTLRTVRPGDRMQPFGMPGRKKLSRLLAENSVARIDRPDQLVVEDQERIVWAVGLTTSEHTRITEETSRVLELELRTRPNDGKGIRP